MLNNRQFVKFGVLLIISIFGILVPLHASLVCEVTGGFQKLADDISTMPDQNWTKHFMLPYAGIDFANTPIHDIHHPRTRE